MTVSRLNVLQDRRAALIAEANLFRDNATAEGRSLTADERKRDAEIERELDRLTTEVQREERNQRYQRFNEPRTENLAGDVVSVDDHTDDPDAGAGLSALPALPRRTVRALDRLFAGVPPSKPETRRASFRGVIAAALGGDPLHPAVSFATGLEGVPSDGGFAVAPDVAREIFLRAVEGSVWLRIGARLEPMTSNEKVVTALDDDDETGDAEATLKAEWTPEAGAANTQVMKLRQMTLTAHKLLILAAISNELHEDAAGDYMPQLEAAVSRAISKKFDRAVLTGTGAGMPLGILNGPSTVTVSKEGSQVAATIQWENVVKMWARLAPGSHEQCWWLTHPTTLPQLHLMSVKVKNVAGSENVGGFQPLGVFQAGGPTGYTMLGRPVLVTSRVKPLGTAGDLILVDPTQVAVGIRRQISIEKSPHVFFNSDRLAVRGRFRGDAQPIWDKPRTLVEGSDAVSPYVVLETRA
jgi:HK97 family phage major capsid protein